MVQCELCGREFKNNQGLAGHRQFVHGIIGRNNQLNAPAAVEQQAAKRDFDPWHLEDMTKDIRHVNEQLEQHTQQFAKFGDQLRSVTQQVRFVSNNEMQNMKSDLTQLRKQVQEHERWFTPDGLSLFISKTTSEPPSFLVDIDQLEKQVRNHQGVINWVKKKFNLVDKRNKS